MSRQILVGIVLSAFVNLLMGCTVTQVEKISSQEAALGLEKIEQLVLLDGSIVRFGPNGGRYATGRSFFRGMAPDGTPLVVPVDSLWQVRLSPSQSITETELDTAHIAEVVLFNNLLVVFSPPGGRYDRSAGAVRGMKPTGETVAYPLTSLKSIRPKRTDVVTVDRYLAHVSPEQRVYEAVSSRYRVFMFDSTGGRLERRSNFLGNDNTGRAVLVPADSLLYASVERVNAGATVLATLGIVVAVIGVAFLIVLATKQSCPFIYAFDGQHYIFDAEPLGGAICPGLARTDISRLDYLKPVDGEYRLLVRNEVPETQYIDQMRLLVIDHTPALNVYPDLQGRFYGFRRIHGAARATDEHGMSLMNFLRTSDKIVWQTHLPAASKDTISPVRHEITVALPKPPEATKAWLITNIGTSSWGSNMIRKTVEYRGRGASAWLASLTPGSEALAELNQFLEREEMYHLKVFVKEGLSWTQRGTILGQGPLISEDRVYPIDVSGAAGDSLVLRFNPPKGFWTMDYIGVSYEEPTVLSPLPIDARLAADQGTRALVDSLRATDHRYYTMPEVGNSANVTFSVPPLAEGQRRSVYLETTGYYQLHLPEDNPQQSARLYSIGIHPGQIVRTAMEEFRAWQREQQAAQYPSLPGDR